MQIGIKKKQHSVAIDGDFLPFFLTIINVNIYYILNI